MLVLRHRGGGDKRDGEKNAKRQVICALIPVSYVRMKGQKKWVVCGKEAGRKMGEEQDKSARMEKKVKREEEVIEEQKDKKRMF